MARSERAADHLRFLPNRLPLTFAGREVETLRGDFWLIAVTLEGRTALV